MRFRWFVALCVLVALWQLHCQYNKRPEDSSRPAVEADGKALSDDKPDDKPDDKTDSESGDSESGAPDEITHDKRRLVRIGTWNIRRLGHGKKRMDTVAGIIEASFDGVALQEVMTREGVTELLGHLPGWKAEVSSRPAGRGTYKEWYAVLYRKDALSVERSFTVRDRHDDYAREPFVVCMRAATFDFCLVNVHIVFGDRAKARDLEIHNLGDTVRRLRDKDREKDWIVVGDFNRAPRTPGWDALVAAGWQFTLPGRVATSLGKNRYSNPYDHILIDDRYTSELSGTAHRVDIVESTCAGDFERCRLEVSDHAPVSARFAAGGTDDD